MKVEGLEEERFSDKRDERVRDFSTFQRRVNTYGRIFPWNDFSLAYRDVQQVQNT